MKIRGRFAIDSGILLLTVCLFSGPVRAQKRAADDLRVLNNVTIVDVRTGTLQPEQTVVLQHHHIASLEPSKSAKYPRNAPLVNCRGLFLIPGLWDMHVHLVFGDWFPGAQGISLPLFVANGVTGVRDMGSELDIVQGWRNDIEAGRLVGPRNYTPGPMLDGPTPRFPSSIAVITAEDGRRTVADLKRGGADFIKLQSLIPRDAVFADRGGSEEGGDSFRGTRTRFRSRERNVCSRDEKLRASDRHFRRELGRGRRLSEGEQNGRTLPRHVRCAARRFSGCDACEESDVAVPDAGVGTRRELD